jgi:Tfp pilus assembly protein PilO
MNYFKNKLILELSISFIIIASLLGGIIFFKNNISNYAQKTTELKEKLNYLTSGVTLLSELQNQYKEVSVYENKLNNIIPAYYDLINFQQDVQALAASQGLTYSFTFAGETPKASNKIGALGFTILVSSQDINKLLNFLNDLQHFRYLITLDNISVSYESNDLKLGINGKVFYK